MAPKETGAQPLDRLREEAQGLAAAVGERARHRVTEKVDDVTERLTGVAEKGGAGLVSALTGGEGLPGKGGLAKTLLKVGASRVKDKVAEALTGGGGPGGSPAKSLTNIVETIDVGVPVTVAYNQWTQFEDFPSFMKKVEDVSQESDTELTWKAQVFLSHRTWKATVVEQVPDERIVWESEGPKGRVDGAVTFHEAAPGLTRILLVLEYRPQGVFEKTGNLWRAQGRRARLELKHFRRHVMTDTVLHEEEVRGWRGVVTDGEVVRSDEEVREEEAEEDEGAEEGADAEDAYDEDEDRDGEDAAEDDGGEDAGAR